MNSSLKKRKDSIFQIKKTEMKNYKKPIEFLMEYSHHYDGKNSFKKDNNKIKYLVVILKVKP